MKLINIGSLNIDRIYRVAHFVTPAETAEALSYREAVGGKGLNQSVAAACAGLPVAHRGKVGRDGDMLVDFLRRAGADVSGIRRTEGPTGHAIIQVDDAGQNCILLFGGANREIRPADVDAWLAEAEAGDVVLLQNETTCVEYAAAAARARGLRVALNPSPITPELLKADLGSVDLFILNEIEGAQLSGRNEPEAIADALEARYPEAAVLLTLGENGSLYACRGERIFCGACRAEKVVDTTGAGDTYTGYFLAGWAGGREVRASMRRAAAAAALAIGRPGAAPSIPTADEVDAAFPAL